MGLKVGTVQLEEYNVNWKVMFSKEKEKLEKIFKNLAIEIEHIGSTSIEGIYAKPIIDIAVGLKKLNDFEKIKNNLKDEPYSIKEDSVCDEILVRKRIGDSTTHLIHIMEIESDRYKNTIIFRDYMRTHKEDLKEYEDLKKALAEKYADNRKMYTASKNEFIHKILEKAYKENTK